MFVYTIGLSLRRDYLGN